MRGTAKTLARAGWPRAEQIILLGGLNFMLRTNFVARAVQPFWRLTRGQTLGTQAVVIDSGEKILLVRHGYRPGWHFPGGGVERGETVHQALARELDEETGVIATEPPVLHGIFANFKAFPGDHIALFVVRSWRRDRIPKPNAEIREQGFFALDELPEGLVSGARNRIEEIFRAAPLKEDW